jgi:uncharacterized lipoprotein YddW (UPF0748 family)
MLQTFLRGVYRSWIAVIGLSCSLPVFLFVSPSSATRLPKREATPQREWRAVWVDAFNPGIKTPAQVDQLVADVKSLHCNMIIAQVRKQGDAYYRKAVDPFTEDAAVPADFDPLAYLLQQAHRHGIQVHAWLNTLVVWRGPQAHPGEAGHVFHRHGPGATGSDNWLTCDEQGQTRFPVGYFLDPGHPEVANHLERVVVDLVQQYPVDGIHLDYIRYPETAGNDQAGYGVGYNPVSVERFNRAHGRDGQPARNDPLWGAWRRQQVTQLVRRLRVSLLAAKPQVVFSSALIAWGDGPKDEPGWEKTAPYNRVFQDWHAWRKEGLLDLTVPMNYDREAQPAQKAFFQHWITFEKAHRYRSQLVIGLGAYLNSVPETAGQLQQALSATDGVPRADGVSLYSYASFRRSDHDDGRLRLDDLRGVLVTSPKSDRDAPPFAEPVPVPGLARLDQPTEGALAGFAVDGMRKPLDSQVVSLQRKGGDEAVLLQTDGNGFYAAPFLPPGDYQVKKAAQGEPEVVRINAGKVVWLGTPPPRRGHP